MDGQTTTLITVGPQECLQTIDNQSRCTKP